MKRNEMLSYIESELAEMLRGLETASKKRRAHVIKNRASDILDMMLGFGMRPPAKETYQVTGLSGESLGQLDDAYEWQEEEE